MVAACNAGPTHRNSSVTPANTAGILIRDVMAFDVRGSPRTLLSVGRRCSLSVIQFKLLEIGAAPPPGGRALLP